MVSRVMGACPANRQALQADSHFGGVFYREHIDMVPDDAILLRCGKQLPEDPVPRSYQIGRRGNG